VNSEIVNSEIVNSEIVNSEIVNSDIDTDYKPWPQRKRPAEQARTKFKGQRIKFG